MQVAPARQGSGESATRRKALPRQVRRAIGVAIVALGASVGALRVAEAWGADRVATPVLAHPAA